MAKKKHPRLPNGFGSIRYLGKGRSNPYAVHPPSTEFYSNGCPITPKALCYVDDWYVGFAVLNAYHAGTYIPGDELAMRSWKESSAAPDALSKRILSDFTARKNAQEKKQEDCLTFAQVYEAFYKWKYENPKKQYSESSKYATRSAFSNASPLHEKIFTRIKQPELQAVIDNCPLKHASLEHIQNLFRQMYAYAKLFEITEKDCSEGVSINIPDDDEVGEPYSGDELKALWEHKDDPDIELILIMCYSGYRIAAYRKMEVNMDEWYFKGGVKTAASKNRIVPIHSLIRPLVSARMARYGSLLPDAESVFRLRSYEVLEHYHIRRHTPHDCRHTFSMLCEKYKVNENDRVRMLGHSFGDITNKVYGHRSLEDLRIEIEKIKNDL